MTDEQTPDAIEPPAEVVSAVIASMRGATVGESDELKAARQEYHERQRLADEAARERRRQFEAQARADQAAAERLRERQAKDERDKARRERTKAIGERISALSNGPDRRLDEVVAGTRRNEAWRNAVIAHGRQQELNAAWDEIFSGWRRLVGVPDPLPLVRVVDDD